jgi:hypothetical protein
MSFWNCRLTIIGPKKLVTAFGDDVGWISTFAALHVEWLRLSPTRHVCEFSTRLPPVTQLDEVSRPWRTLTLLLDYEDEKNRIKGLAKGGTDQHHWLRY